MPALADSGAGGLIPAHAGKTLHRLQDRSPRGAHPRSRGENGKADDNLRLAAGSSPLTRGKRNDNPRDPLSTGLIPAHAGKTAARPRSGSPRRAHPRSRGENLDGQRETAEEWGSSPLTRGKLAADEGLAACERLIPAHAGKTGGDCGGDGRDAGSSPLTRGKHMGVNGLRAGRGLIPAHAGKTSRPAVARGRPAAHPRSRGENRSSGRAPL